MSGNNPAYEKLASTLATSLQKETTSLIEITSHTVQNPEKSLPESIKAADVLVTLGPSATSLALNAPTKAKIISTFITQNAMSKLIAQHKSADPNTNNRLIGAVYLDQPAKRLLQLALLINPELKQIGMLTGALSRSRTPEFRQQAASLSIAIDTQSLEPHDNPIKILEPIMANSQAYIVLPDTADFNRNTARWIIYLSYRYAVPVIGYSNRYIDAGALASIFSTPEQMGKQAAEQVIALLKEPSETPRFEHPNYYLVRLNEKVQRSLGYTQLDETVLSHQLNALEKAWTKSSRQEGLEHNE
ncbi:MAG: hypothetical protein K9K86_04890 [Pseudomonadales bacterium]|nr:hypothetical protein [Pseudomonadales bacterium]